MSGHRELLRLGPGFWLGPVMVSVSFVLSVFIQAVSLFAIPGIILGKLKLLPAVGRSIFLSFRYFGVVVLFAFLVMAAYIPFIVLQFNTARLINFSPESVLWINFAGMFVNSLIIDVFLTVGAAILYLKLEETT
jgi:hypothetical protein